MNLKIYCDGGARGNPGPAAAAFIIKDDAGNLRYKCGKFLGVRTNNEAEYQAVIEGLSYLRGLGGLSRVHFFLDSNLVVNQLNGVFKIKEARLRELLLKVRSLESEVGKTRGGQDSRLEINYFYVPREQNAAADLLVNQTLDRAVEESEPNTFEERKSEGGEKKGESRDDGILPRVGDLN